MNKKEQPTVTLPLVDVVHAIIGDETSAVEWAPISWNMAAVLAIALQNHQSLAVVTTEDFDGNPLDTPRLWSARHYRIDLQIHKNQLAYKEAQRIKYQIRESNIRNLVKCIIDKTGLNEEQVRPLATRLWDKGDKTIWSVFGLVKVITREDEL